MEKDFHYQYNSLHVFDHAICSGFFYKVTINTGENNKRKIIGTLWKVTGDRLIEVCSE